MSDHPHNTRFLSTLSLRRATNSFHEKGQANNISIHALLAESDLGNVAVELPMWKFLSTLSLRRATRLSCRRLHSNAFLSTLSLRRATSLFCVGFCLGAISIHALLAESDKGTCNLLDAHRVFLSTLSLRRATLLIVLMTSLLVYFYPRSPCGERQQSASYNSYLEDFYPRSPCGERRKPRALKSRR